MPDIETIAVMVALFGVTNAGIFMLYSKTNRLIIMVSVLWREHVHNHGGQPLAGVNEL